MEFDEGGLNVVPPPTPPKDTICHWDGGEGAARFHLAWKGRAGDAIITRWTMRTMKTMMIVMARGQSKGRSIIVFHSISA